MNHWKVVLNTGEIVEEGIGEWIEIPGESLPWRRLCEYLEKEGKWIDTLYIVTPKGNVDITHMGDEIVPAPDFYSIENDLVIDNVMGGGSVTNTLHVAAHYSDSVIHTYFLNEGLLEYTLSKEEYKPLVPSPRRKVEAK